MTAEEPDPARTSRWGWVIIVGAVLVLVVGLYVALRPAADSGDTNGATAGDVTTTAPPAPSTPPATEPPPPLAAGTDGLDWITAVDGVGVLGSDGRVLMESPFSLSWDKRAAWDGGDGFAYVGDDRTLWWARPSATEAVLDLADVDFLWALVDVTTTDDGPVAILRDPLADAGPDGLRWVALETGEDVPAVEGVLDTPSTEWLGIRFGAQGRWAGIDQPDWSQVEFGADGVPVPPYPLPELVITDDGGEELLRLELGDFDNPIAMLHDFDGRRLIVSVEAMEPATGIRGVHIVDLECADCTTTISTGGPDSFDLVGVLESSGPVTVTALG